MLKQCFKCSELLPLAEFPKRKGVPDGHRGKCKACTASWVRKWYHEDPEARRAWERQNNKKRDPATRWAAQKKYSAANRHKRRAHLSVHRAIKSGKLTRPDNCERCTGPADHAHHGNYDKPLDVVWLCAPCHGLAHRIGA